MHPLKEYNEDLVRALDGLVDRTLADAEQAEAMGMDHLADMHFKEALVDDELMQGLKMAMEWKPDVSKSG